jgi:hypothetical protein
MKINCFVYRNIGLSCLVLAVLVNCASGTPGQCGATPKCGRTCGRAGSSGVACYVRVSRGSNWGVEVSAQDSLPGGDVCIAPGTKISWFTVDPSSNFTVTFGSPHPFGTGTPPSPFKGDENATPKSKSVTTLGCSQYSVQLCITGSAPPCVTADPKVIVTGGTDEGGKHSKHSIKH